MTQMISDFFNPANSLKLIATSPFRNRVYSETLGRFLQTDPIRFDAGDVNIYRYCGNRVNTHTDPYGQFTIEVRISSGLSAGSAATIGSFLAGERDRKELFGIFMGAFAIGFIKPENGLTGAIFIGSVALEYISKFVEEYAKHFVNRLNSLNDILENLPDPDPDRYDPSRNRGSNPKGNNSKVSSSSDFRKICSSKNEASRGATASFYTQYYAYDSTGREVNTTDAEWARGKGARKFGGFSTRQVEIYQ